MINLTIGIILFPFVLYGVIYMVWFQYRCIVRLFCKLGLDYCDSSVIGIVCCWLEFTFISTGVGICLV